MHYTTFQFTDGKYITACSAGDLSEKYEARNAAFLACHLHILETGVAELELASAGKADHD